MSEHDPLDDSCLCDEYDDNWLDDESWWCLDCQVHTGVIGEYYMVNNDLWETYVGDPAMGADGSGMLCIRCLENRLMRRLEPSDFSDAPLNNIATPYHRSTRLLERLGTS